MELRSLQHEKRRCDNCQRKRGRKLARQRYRRMKRENPEAWARLQAKTKEKNAANAAKRKAKYVPHPLTPEKRTEICLNATAVRDALRSQQIPRWNGESDPNTVIANPKYEKDAGIIKEFVICRKCGKQVSSITGHLGKNVHPGTDLAKYRRDHPGAPIYSLISMKRNRDFHRLDLKAKPERYASYRAIRKDRLRAERAELAELRAKAATGSRPGPAKKAHDERQFFRIGELVQAKIDNGKDLTAARRAVALSKNLKYSTVVRHHKQFRSLKPTSSTR
jgi:hypothetical protein